MSLITDVREQLPVEIVPTFDSIQKTLQINNAVLQSKSQRRHIRSISVTRNLIAKARPNFAESIFLKELEIQLQALRDNLKALKLSSTPA